MKGTLAIGLKSYVENYMGLPKVCWEGIGLSFLNATSVGICFFLSVYFVDSLEFTVSTAGLLVSVYGFGTVVGGIFAGRLCDKINPRLVLIISLILQTIAFLLLAVFQSFEYLIINLFFLGVGAYGFKTSNNVWLLAECEQDVSIRLKTINIVYVVSNLGFGISGIIVGLFSTHNFKTIFLISSMLLFVSSIYVYLSGMQNFTLVYNNQTIYPNEELKKSTSLNRKVVGVILICLFIVGLMLAQLGSTYPIYIQNTFSSLGLKAVSILFMLDTILIVLFQAPLVSGISKNNKIMVAGFGAFLMGLGMLILSLSFSFFSLGILSCVIWTTGEMLFMSTAQLVCYEKGGEKKKGQILGAYQSTYALSCVLGPMLGGAIYEVLGGNILWIVCFCLGSLSFILCLGIKNYD